MVARVKAEEGSLFYVVLSFVFFVMGGYLSPGGWSVLLQ